MEPSWNSTEECVQYANVTGPGTGLMLRLIVEKVPGSGSWDWVVSQRGAHEIAPKSGRECSLISARSACESAALTWIGDNRGQPRG
jgi:hypothetical protein